MTFAARIDVHQHIVAPVWARALDAAGTVKAPHLSMISDPGVVTSVILQAVQATT
jgi:hypothetical protein